MSELVEGKTPLVADHEGRRDTCPPTGVSDRGETLCEGGGLRQYGRWWDTDRRPAAPSQGLERPVHADERPASEGHFGGSGAGSPPRARQLIPCAATMPIEAVPRTRDAGRIVRQVLRHLRIPGSRRSHCGNPRRNRAPGGPSPHKETGPSGPAARPRARARPTEIPQWKAQPRQSCESGTRAPPRPFARICEWEPPVDFVAATTEKSHLYPMAEPLARINVMGYRTGEALNWHLDRAEFTTTILLQAPFAGGVFQYRSGLRSDLDPNHEGVGRLLVGEDDNTGEPPPAMVIPSRHARRA